MCIGNDRLRYDNCNTTQIVLPFVVQISAFKFTVPGLYDSRQLFVSSADLRDKTQPDVTWNDHVRLRPAKNTPNTPIVSTDALSSRRLWAVAEIRRLGARQVAGFVHTPERRRSAFAPRTSDTCCTHTHVPFKIVLSPLRHGRRRLHDYDTWRWSIYWLVYLTSRLHKKLQTNMDTTFGKFYI